jgi:SNF2 family DNA or RNA helicase
LTFRRKELLQLKDFTLMLDESSLIQNEKTKRSKFVLKLEPKNLILLSGTPTGGKYEKLFSQLHLLGWDITKELYWKQYIETEWFETDDGYFMKKIVGYKNVERLKAKLRQHGAIFMKSEEVFDLPEQIHINVNVPVTKEYRKFLQKRLVSIDNVELVGDTILTFRLYQRMLCGQYNPNKLEAFKDLIDSSDDRFIVFYNFNEELDRMMQLTEDRPVSIVNGSVKDLSAFESEPNSITFIQYQAGAMGLNLQKANKIIYFTPPDGRSELFEQSKKRTHRIGQTETCFYYHLIVSDSIEERIHENLLMLRDYTDDLFKQDYLKGRELNE